MNTFDEIEIIDVEKQKENFKNNFNYDYGINSSCNYTYSF